MVYIHRLLLSVFGVFFLVQESTQGTKVSFEVEGRGYFCHVPNEDWATNRYSNPPSHIECPVLAEWPTFEYSHLGMKTWLTDGIRCTINRNKKEAKDCTLGAFPQGQFW